MNRDKLYFSKYDKKSLITRIPMKNAVVEPTSSRSQSIGSPDLKDLNPVNVPAPIITGTASKNENFAACCLE